MESLLFIVTVIINIVVDIDVLNWAIEHTVGFGFVSFLHIPYVLVITGTIILMAYYAGSDCETIEETTYARYISIASTFLDALLIAGFWYGIQSLNGFFTGLLTIVGVICMPIPMIYMRRLAQNLALQPARNKNIARRKAIASKYLSKVSKEHKKITELLNALEGQDEHILDLDIVNNSTVGLKVKTNKDVKLVRSQDFVKMMNNDEAYDYYQSIKNRWCSQYQGETLSDVLDDILHKEFYSIIDHHTQVFQRLEKYTLNRYPDSEAQKELHAEMMKAWVPYEQMVSFYKNYFNTRAKLVKSRAQGLALGKKGEDFVDKYLGTYDGLFYNLKNHRVEFKGEKIENDHILISPTGVYVIEVKNFGENGNYNLRIEKDGRWSKIYKNGKVEFFEKSPIQQNDRHIVYLYQLINSELGRNMADAIEVKGIVAIGNNVINIQNESSQHIVRAEGIYNIISQYPKYLSMEEIELIKVALEKHKIDVQKYPTVDIFQEFQYNLEMFKKQMQIYTKPLDTISTQLDKCEAITI